VEGPTPEGRATRLIRPGLPKSNKGKRDKGMEREAPGFEPLHSNTKSTYKLLETMWFEKPAMRLVAYIM